MHSRQLLSVKDAVSNFEINHPQSFSNLRLNDISLERIVPLDFASLPKHASELQYLFWINKSDLKISSRLLRRGED